MLFNVTPEELLAESNLLGCSQCALFLSRKLLRNKVTKQCYNTYKVSRQLW